jgi:hypothetical protein
MYCTNRKWEELKRGITSLPREQVSEALKSRIYEKIRASRAESARSSFRLRYAAVLAAFAFLALTAAGAVVVIKVRASIKASAAQRAALQAKETKPQVREPEQAVPEPVEPTAPPENKIAPARVIPKNDFPQASDSGKTVRVKKEALESKAQKKSERLQEKDAKQLERAEKRIEQQERTEERKTRQKEH